MSTGDNKMKNEHLSILKGVLTYLSVNRQNTCTNQLS